MISSGRAHRERGRAGVRSLLGSIAVHGLALVAAWAAMRTAPAPAIDFISFDIDLVSAPAAKDLGSPVVEAPDPTPPAPEPKPEPTPPPPKAEPKVEKPAPKSEPKPKAEPKPVEPKPAPSNTPSTPNRPAAAPRPTASGPTTDKATGTESAESINVRMEGLRRDYPVYYDNIIRQISRCFRWNGSQALEVEVYFVILQGGGVDDMRIVRSSTDRALDYEALGAIECAGQPGRFGPLPDDLPFDRLPVRFKFSPGGAGIFR